MPKGEPDFKLLGQLAVLSQIGLEMAAPVGIGVALDLYLHWGPWASICGAVLGLVGGMAHLMAILKRVRKQSSSGQQREDT